jgi:hypothetical protein
MASQKQLRANRENAKKSTGPKTATGRAKSSRNAFRHGLSRPLALNAETAEKARAWPPSRWRKPSWICHASAASERR